MLESIADPIRLRVVQHIDEHGAASLPELAIAADVHVNTIRPHLQAMEQDGLLDSRQRRAQGPGRRVIEYYLVQPLTLADTDFASMTELLAAALSRAQLGADQLRQIGADWGRYLSGRPAKRDPENHLRDVLGHFGFRTTVSPTEVKLERCLCPLVSPDAPLNICTLIEGVVDGALAATGSDLRVRSAEHHPEARSCRVRLKAHS